MQAIVYRRQPDNHYGFETIEKKMPDPSGHDLLVEIKAISVNPVDYKVKNMIAEGKPMVETLGFDAAGVVKAAGEKVRLFKPGDFVYYAGDITRDGSYAEYQLVDERIAGKHPQSLDFTQAAAMPLTSLTAWEILFDRLKLHEESRQNVLITGAAGGVGSILVQLLKHKTRCQIITTYGRAQSREWLNRLGSDRSINHKHDLAEQLQEQGINGIDIIISLTHTDQYVSQFAEIIEPQGDLVFIDEPRHFDLLAFKKKSISVHMEFMFTRSMYQTPDMIRQHEILNELADLIDKGVICSTMNESLGKINVANIVKAHDLLESGESRGKIILHQ
ncbi:zinc-binding alcohol dehydrogenase family protein [Legionella spiritensis]|uniref:zinc-binding alcohol dehydrogenase family protein n=1 Tax=Legionella spiritensis TaxID=452 RepID=UPI000F6C3ADE|nr:zinc-binding alcohol dehydrogenase family protein [Legionella spiritensis]VEG92154.1 NADPH-quinone reductase and Zn-dependent oxidoreductase [Legionella spiritensis]